MTQATSKDTAGLTFEHKPLVIVISGPSGVGKDAILNRMKARKYPFYFVTTVTTRKKRNNETDLVDYHFVSTGEYQNLLSNGELLESANVYGNWYGVPKQPVRDAVLKGRDVIIKVDVQGAASIKKILPEAVFIFINAPSLEELSTRLNHRCSETTHDLSLRIQTAQSELKRICDFDYVVMNQSNDIDRAIENILAIIKSEKCRVKQRHVQI